MFSPISILVVTVLSSVMSLLVLGSLSRAQVPGVRRWIAAMSLAVLALICITFQNHVTPLLTIFFANIGLAVAMVISVEGTLEYFGQPARFRLGRIGCGALLAAFVYYFYVSPSFPARVVAISLFDFLSYAYLTLLVFRYRPRNRAAYAYHFVGWTSLLICIAYLIRAGCYAFTPIAESQLMVPSVLNVTFLALGILTLPVMSTGIVMIAHDFIAQRLEHAANHDDLTGIMTRRAFFVHADHTLAEQSKSPEPAAIAIVDLDHFKRINDTYGHAGGDLALRHFSALIRSRLRSTDLFARLGGEEFAVLFPATSADDARQRLDALRAEVSESPCRIGRKTFHYSFSAGIASHRPTEMLSALIARADHALYRAKSEGRNRVLVSPR